jgi:hypothetical protein
MSLVEVKGVLFVVPDGLLWITHLANSRKAKKTLEKY